MQQIYKILTAFLALTGCVSIIMSGEINPLMSITGIGLLFGYHRSLKNMPPAPGWAISGLSALTLIVFIFDYLIVSGDYFIAVAHLTITFQAIKSFDLKEPWDNLQVYFMSLLQLIIASELTSSIAFGILFVFFLVALVNTIVFSHFIKEGVILKKIDIRRPLIYISSLTLLVTLIFFISIPRVSGGLWGKSHLKRIKTAGFSEKVEFGSFGDMILDHTIIMRVELSSNAKEPYYWRGMTLNYFDRISWKNIFQKRTQIYKEGNLFNIKPFKKEEAVIQSIFLEPLDTDVVFGLSEIAAVESKGLNIFMDNAGSLFLPWKKGKRFAYVVYSINDQNNPPSPPFSKGGKGGLSGENINNYLKMPSGMEKISRLAYKIISRKDKDIEKAIKIENYLRNNYMYSLSTSPPPDGVSPVEDFLFNTKKGYCEHYATSMVLMLRAVGIPARIVTGYLGGELNEYGNYIIVRQSNTHSWVEAAIDGVWKRFDPTPPIDVKRPSAIALYIDMLKMKWNRYIIAFSLSDQKAILKTFSLPLRIPLMPDVGFRKFYVIYFLLTLIVLAAIIFLLRHLKFRRYGFVTAQYIKARKIIKNRGAKITLSSTPSEVEKEAIKIGMSNKISEFIKLYEEYRFSGKEIRCEDRVRYRNLIKEIRKQFKRFRLNRKVSKTNV
ncbi:MAG: DUF3488 and transglutaminase-like domain-containing protein [Nitrospirota bacterium]